MSSPPSEYQDTRRRLKDFINSWRAKNPEGRSVDLYNAIRQAGLSTPFLRATAATRDPETVQEATEDRATTAEGEIPELVENGSETAPTPAPPSPRPGPSWRQDTPPDSPLSSVYQSPASSPAPQPRILHPEIQPLGGQPVGYIPSPLPPRRPFL